MQRWFEDYKTLSLCLASDSVVCLGNFDGLHLGHQNLISCAISEAKSRNLASILMTFSPHPSRVLRPQSKEPTLLLNSQEKNDLLKRWAIDIFLVQEFSRDFSEIPAEVFAKDLLSDRLRARRVIVGSNFRFGYKALGTVETLREAARFDVIESESILSGSEMISSSRIRSLIGDGEVRRASSLLGYPYFIHGSVIRGEGRGRGIGFPTANIQFEKDCVPKSGVYSALAQGSFGLSKAILNFGLRPTFSTASTTRRTLEVHLLNQNRLDLYHQDLQIFFIDRVRDERKFVTVDALKAQINQDIALAERQLEGCSLSDSPLSAFGSK